MKLVTLITSAFFVLWIVPSFVRSAEPDAAERAAIAAVKKMGGQVTVHGDRAIKVGFRDTAISDDALARLSPLTGLVNVAVFQSNQLTGPGLAHLKPLENLESLYLPGTAVGDEGLKHIGQMTQLVNLYLPQTRITDAGLQHLEKLAALRVLYLDETDITDAGLAHLQSLNLVALSLTETQISDAGLEQLKGQTKLSMLYLRDAAISDQGLEHLKFLRNLVQLDLRKTGVTNAGVRSLQDALPNCKIEF
jgi:internalin A